MTEEERKEKLAIYEAYFESECRKANAHLPQQKLVVLARMKQELHEQGIMPDDGRSLYQFNVDHPLYGPLLRGEAIESVSATQIATPAVGSKGQLGTGAKVGVLVALFAFFLLLGGVAIWATRPSADTTSTLTPALAGIVEATATELGGGETPAPTTATPLPSPAITVQAVTPSPTPVPVMTSRGEVADTPSDPASIEIMGLSYLLTKGEVVNGQWQPRVAEWLIGSTIRRVVAVPYSAELLDRLQSGPLSPILLRLRNGEIVSYTATELTSLRTHQIEALTSTSPSVILILTTEGESAERWVVLGAFLP